MPQLPVSFITENVVCHTVPLGEGITGYVYLSKKGRYHIFISDTLSPEVTKEVFFHELHHILFDLPKMPYTIGLNMQRSDMENKANDFARQFSKVSSILL